MKEFPHIILSEEQEKQETIKCVAWATCFVLSCLCLMIYGMAWMSAVEKENTAFYGAKHLEKRVKWLETWSKAMVVYSGEKQAEYENHTHRYSDGRVK